MAYESWRMSRMELRDLWNKYEKAVEEDAAGLLRPTEAERKALGKEVLEARLARMRQSREANRAFIEAVVADLPDLCAGPGSDQPPLRPVCEFRELPSGIPTLPSSSYGSLASVFLHLLRDWSEQCQHVYDSTYAPAIKELSRLLPLGGEVLVPGCGLARLALALAAEGYQVEANEGSRLFLTVADYVLNRPPPENAKLFPLAHVFPENWSHQQQYIEISVPQPSPLKAATKKGGEAPSSGKPALTMIPGDFVRTYSKGGLGHRKFGAIVTCFFLDTVTDIVELMDVMDDLLDEGGVWVNIGPLNFRKDTRLKLNWAEIRIMWENKGYTFLAESGQDTDYHLQRGLKMYTESYHCALTAAQKGKQSKV